ncbi:MAG: 4-(cytidine 5'-diphospho)-2-C-methyl-D-erythritol kinase [Treponema sp.]|nr:4-(cytidine 5'-diphospho)-2-C-methyl-D-erythritol kinase [Treponema sp.]
MKFILERAYAKVNFNLRVLPCRTDGYHNIESIFQTIDLFDELEVSVKEENGCFVECNSLELPLQNTLTKAYDAFCSIADVSVPGVRVVLKKGIPSGGGLGGGSSDAAALVRALSKICKIKLDENQLDYIADKTGSDVFFFMHCDEDGTGCALVSGRGEVIKKITPRKDLFLLLVFPEISSSTKEAYALVDKQLARGTENDFVVFDSLEEEYRKNPSDWRFKNTFTPSLCGVYSDLEAALGTLKNSGADFCDMSGSGSTIYGVFTSKQRAKSNMKLLAATWNCALVRLL